MTKQDRRKTLNTPKIRKLKTSTLLIGILVELIFSIFLGATAGARGLGSLYPQLNLVAKPFVCPNSPMSYTQTVTELGSDTYYSARWSCGNEGSGQKAELDPATIFLYATPFYSLVFFAGFLLLTYIYWNSSVGPAQNDGLRLW